MAVLIDLGIWIEYLENERSRNKIAGAVFPTPSFHLRDSCSIAIMPVLELCLK